MEKPKNSSFLKTLGRVYLWILLGMISISLMIAPVFLGALIKNSQPIWGWVIVIPMLFHIGLRTLFYLNDEESVNGEDIPPGYNFLKKEGWLFYRSTIMLIVLVIATAIFGAILSIPLFLAKFTGYKICLALYAILIPALIGGGIYHEHRRT